MATVSDVLHFLNTLAPLDLAEEWDNVGLLCGNAETEVHRVLVALDPFMDVCREADEMGAELIVTHHPLIFHPLKTVTDEDPTGRCVRFLCRKQISAINAHTNLDMAPGGVNDALAARLGLQGIAPIPCPGGRKSLLRCGSVPEQSLDAFLSRVKERLGCPGLRYVSGGRPVQRVAVGGGACGSELSSALGAGCDTFVTSDIKYNQFWDAHGLGLNLIDAGHFYTENPVVPVLAGRIAAAFPEIRVEISKNHRDCMAFY